MAAMSVRMEVFWRLHTGLPQQAPGSEASTLRALAAVPGLAAAPRILDVGCGPGRHTLSLAKATGGHVTAVDRVAPFLAELEERALAAGLADRIVAHEGSMLELPFAPSSFDLLWSEGAIYGVGFDHGLATLRPLLRPGGTFALTDAAWLGPPPPPRVETFWREAYPAMRSREANRAAIARAGFRLVEEFVLPDSDWAAYYDEYARRVESWRAESPSAEIQDALDAAEEEVQVWRESAGSYGYVFFVMLRDA